MLNVKFKQIKKLHNVLFMRFYVLLLWFEQ